MPQRFDLSKLEPASYRALLALERAVRESGLEASIRHLVKTRASLLNGCAYCIDMHTAEALADGETKERLFLLPAWHEAPCFTDKERAALALTDAATRLGEGGVSDAVWAEAVRLWGEDGTGKLLFVIATINAWNRIGVATRLVPESFKKSAS